MEDRIIFSFIITEWITSPQKESRLLKMFDNFINLLYFLIYYYYN